MNKKKDANEILLKTAGIFTIIIAIVFLGIILADIQDNQEEYKDEYIINNVTCYDGYRPLFSERFYLSNCTDRAEYETEQYTKRRTKIEWLSLKKSFAIAKHHTLTATHTSYAHTAGE